MTVTRIAISLDAELAKEIKRSAGSTPVSRWLAEAAASRLRAEGLRKVVDDWEREHGAFTEEERASAQRLFDEASRRARGTKRRRR